MAEPKEFPTAQKVFCVLLGVIAVWFVFAGIQDIINERQLTTSSSTVMAVVTRVFSKTSGGIFGRGSNASSGSTVHYAQVEYKDAGGVARKAKIVIAGSGVIDRGDTVEVVYAPSEPSLARLSASRQSRSFMDVYVNGSLIAAVLSLACFYYFGGGVLLGLTKEVPFEPRSP